jgi:AcrR family transcriptional regulator
VRRTGSGKVDRGRQRPHVGISRDELQRARILAAMGSIVDANGFTDASVTAIATNAGVPRAAFYQHFCNREDALGALVENALTRSRTRVLDASEPQGGWLEKTRAGLLALLALFEAEPETGRLCLIHTHRPVPRIARARDDMLEQLARHIAAGAAEGQRPAATITPECTVAGVLGVLESRLGEPRAPQLLELAGELLSFIVLPYCGAAAAQAERLRQTSPPKPRRGARATREWSPVEMRITYRTMRVLAAVASSPGLSNVEVGERAGVSDAGQISKLLKRLQGLGLIQNTGGGQELGTANAWWLTEDGQSTERYLLEHHLPRRK